MCASGPARSQHSRVADPACTPKAQHQRAVAGDPECRRSRRPLTLSAPAGSFGTISLCQGRHSGAVSCSDWGDGMPVDLGGHGYGPVSEGVGDVFQRHPGGREQACGGVPEQMRVYVPEPGLLSDTSERPSHVGRVERRPGLPSEDQVESFAATASEALRVRLATRTLIDKRSDGCVRQRERASTCRRLGVNEDHAGGGASEAGVDTEDRVVTVQVYAAPGEPGRLARAEAKQQRHRDQVPEAGLTSPYHHDPVSRGIRYRPAATGCEHDLSG